MPIVTVKVSAARSVDLSKAIANMVLELTVRLLGKKPEVDAAVATLAGCD